MSIPSAIEKLSILVHQNGLSFYCYVGEEMIYLDNHTSGKNPNELYKLLATYLEQNSSQLSDCSVEIVYSHSLFTVVPKAYFNKDAAGDYLKYNARILPNDAVSSDVIDDRVVVYIAYENLNNLLVDRFGEAEYYHLASKLLSNSSNTKDQKSIKLDIILLEHQFFLHVAQGSNLLALNLYDCYDAQDVLYYTLFLKEQLNLQLDQIDTKLYASEGAESTKTLLRRYIPNLKNVNLQQFLSQMLCA